MRSYPPEPSSTASARATSSPSRGAVRLEQDAAVDPHRERGADGFLGGIASQSDDDSLSGAACLLEPQRRFDGKLVVGIGDELDAVSSIDFPSDPMTILVVGVGNPLETDRDFHSLTSGDWSGAVLPRGK